MPTGATDARKTIMILSLTSDIGVALAERYAKEGHRIIGTYRTKQHLGLLKGVPDPRLFYCDVEDKESIGRFLHEYKQLNLPWDVFISLPCTPCRSGRFFKASSMTGASPSMSTPLSNCASFTGSTR